MRVTHPLHNPFVNRFNDPVTRRNDDMQSHEYMVWLRERDEIGSAVQKSLETMAQQPVNGRVFASLLGLFVLIASFAVLIRAL